MTSHGGPVTSHRSPIIADYSRIADLVSDYARIADLAGEGKAASFRVLNRTETTKLVKSFPRIALFRHFHVF